jgi:hypothetical protein
MFGAPASSGFGREECVMAANGMNGDDEAGDDEPASQRVETFLAYLETSEQRSRRVRRIAAAVGTLVAVVAFLTSIGVVQADARRISASAGAFVHAFLANDR